MANLIRTSPLLPFFTGLGYSSTPAASGAVAEYTGADAEYDALIHGAGIRDITAATVLELRGKDSLDYIHRISTNDLKRLFPGGMARTVFTSDKGRILDSVAILHLGDRQLLVGHHGTENTLFGWLNKYIIMDDVTVHRVPDDFVLLEVIGVQAEALMTLLFGKDVQELSAGVLTQSSINDQTVPFFKIREFGSRFKYLILTTKDTASTVIRAALGADTIIQTAIVGETAYEHYRIEHGILSANELNDLYNPHEAGLKHEISFTKGCYIGQEVIARLDTYDKVQKHLSGVVCKGAEGISSPAALLTADGQEAGTLTSLVYSKQLGKHVGLAYIRRQFLGQQMPFTVQGAEKSEVREAALPLITI